MERPCIGRVAIEVSVNLDLRSQTLVVVTGHEYISKPRHDLLSLDSSSTSPPEQSSQITPDTLLLHPLLHTTEKHHSTFCVENKSPWVAASIDVSTS